MKTVAAEWEKFDSWDGTPVPPEPPALIEDPVSARISVGDATTVFLANREGANIARHIAQTPDVHEAAISFR